MYQNKIFKLFLFSTEDTMWITIGSGLVIACVWQMFTICLSEKFSKLFAIFVLAFFCSCIAYYKLPGMYE